MVSLLTGNPCSSLFIYTVIDTGQTGTGKQQTDTFSLKQIPMKKTLLLLFVLTAQYGYSQCTFTYSYINCSCFGLCDGLATVTPTGGTPPYTFQWSSGQTTQTITGLCAGPAPTCSVSDASGPCAAQNPSPVISEPPLLSVLISGVAGPCDTCDTVSAIVNGGTPPHVYLWSNGDTGQSILVCGGGNYTITVSDANSCTASASVTVTFPPPLTISLTVTNATCDTCCDGNIVATAGGGTPAYAFTYSPSAPPWCAGTVYVYCVTDMNGCIACDTSIISYPTSINENISDAGIKIFPNPFSTSATIILNSEFRIENAELKMYDMLGREVFKSSIINNKLSISRGSLQNGMYFYRVMSDTGMIAAGKILVE